MNKEQLGHIFERSACLTPKQIKGYVSGKMVHEEAHAVEVHLLSCPFCRDAIDGLREQKDAGAINAMEKLDAGFIASHFGVSKDELSLKDKKVKGSNQSSFKTFTEKVGGGNAGGNIRKMWRPLAAAAGLVAVACILYFMRESIFPAGENKQIAQNTEADNTTAPEPATPDIAYRPAVDSIEADTPIIAMNETEDMAQLPPQEEDMRDAMAEKRELKKPDDTKKKQEQAKYAEQKDKGNATMLAAANPVKKSQKKPAKQAPDLAANADDKRMGNSFTGPKLGPMKVDEEPEAAKKPEPEKAAPKPEPKKINLGEARSGIPDGDEAFNDGKYKKALRQYKKVMFDPKSNQKDAATLMAAKCHIAEEELMQARTLLNSLVKENSVKKDEAAALLKQLPKEE